MKLPHLAKQQSPDKEDTTVEFLEIKTTVCEMKNMQNGIKSRLDTKEKKVSERE